MKAYIRSCTRIAGNGRRKLSNFLQEAWGEDYRGTIEGWKSENTVGKPFEGAVDKFRALLKPVPSLAYALEYKGRHQLSAHEGVMAFGLRVAQPGKENDKGQDGYQGCQ